MFAMTCGRTHSRHISLRGWLRCWRDYEKDAGESMTRSMERTSERHFLPAHLLARTGPRYGGWNQTHGGNVSEIANSRKISGPLQVWPGQSLDCGRQKSGGGGGRKSNVFGKPCICPLPKIGCFQESSENDEVALNPKQQGFCSSNPPKTTTMAGVTETKACSTKSIASFCVVHMQE